MHLFKFGFVNKTYDKDFYWSLHLYMSFERFVKDAPFFIVSPEDTMPKLLNIFRAAMRDKKIRSFPFFLSDEMVLDAANEIIPNNFTGWHIQQVIKLAFSLTGYCETYMTIDSAVLFTSPFDWAHLLFRNGKICTGALPENRKSLRDRIIKFGEYSTIKGETVSLADALDYIDSAFGCMGDSTFWHVSSNGFFDSKIVISLIDHLSSEGFIRSDSGLSDIISLVPCEFAWYGSFVANLRKDEFYPLNPNIFSPCVNRDDYDAYLSKRYQIPDEYYGILFHKQDLFNAEPKEFFDGFFA